jgi:prepilin-type N-terminal cleavage/methylation domain-containing protein
MHFNDMKPSIFRRSVSGISHSSKAVVLPSASNRGFTLVELMVSMGVGALVLTGVAAVFLASNISFSAVGNYVSLDRSSENALDQMSRDIRRSANLTSFAANQLVFNYVGSTNLVLTYDASAGNLTSWKTGDAATNILLTGCDSLQFSMYSSIPQSGGNLTNTTTISKAKAISVNWRCSRTILGKRRNTEDTQEAVIVIRNKPVL